METLRAYAMEMVGTPYKYGGNNPLSGLDCSGLACELMRSAGVIAWNEDLSAQGLFDRFAGHGGDNKWGMGSLAFFGESPTKITHVGFCLDQYRMLEAGGGDHLTLTINDAMAKNAFVKIRPIKHRSDLVMVVKPDYSPIGLIS